MPAVCDSFCLLARLPFRQRMRPGVYIGGQCLCGLPSDSRASAEKRPLESTLSRTRNTWRGVRAPRAARNVPRAAPRGHWAADPAPVRRAAYPVSCPAAYPVWASNFLKRMFTSVETWDPVRDCVKRLVSAYFGSRRAGRGGGAGKRHQGAGFSQTIQ